MYTQTTNDITISVEPTFLESQSSPLDNEYIWAYQVKIENRSVQTVQLKTRTWRIIDAHGHMHEVHGEGVVGEEPVLAPGEVFEYVSGTPLQTPSGIMQGSYGMIAIGGKNSGDRFEAAVPAFSLDSPHERQQLN